MTIVKISRQYLIAEDQDSITIDLPASVVKQLRHDYSKVKRAQGILKDRKAEMLSHLDQIRQEWE